MKNKIKEKKSAITTPNNKHRLATSLFLGQLVILPIITILGTFASFAMFRCDTPDITHANCTNDPTAGGLWLFAALIAFAALFAWFKNQRLISIRLSKVLIAIPSVAGLISGGSILLGLAHYVDPTEAVVTLLLSATPIALLVFITVNQRYIIKEANSAMPSLIAKTLFITQLLIFILMSTESIFNSCADTGCRQYDLPNSIFSLILSLLGIAAFITWLFKKRALSVRLSQTGLTVLVLGMIGESIYVIWQYSMLPLAERAKSLEWFGLFPTYIPLVLIILSLPFACLYLITRYKKQIIES